MSEGLEKGEHVVRRLVELSRTTIVSGADFRSDATFAAVQRARAKDRTVAGAVRRYGALASLGAATLALALVFWFPKPADGALTFEVVNGAVGNNGEVVGSSTGTSIRFSDGSRVNLARDTQARIPELTARGGELALTRGTLNVKVRHLPGAAWSVNAGPYSVQVTGTAFDVTWTEAEKIFELALHEGSVTVRGPFANGVKMVAGQRLRAQVGTGTMTIENTRPGQPSTRGGAAPADVVAPAEPRETDSPARPPASASRGTESWRARLAKGEYDAVVEAAERRGIAQVLSSGSLEELGALADAARYSRRSDLAQRTLASIRQRFSGSTRAREATFFLGRLAEEQGNLTGALEWYDRYLGQNGNGVYVSQALGRKMLISHRQQGATAAQAIAADYLARFPKGAYAEAARKIQGQ
jgi:hypothetical protein